MATFGRRKAPSTCLLPPLLTALVLVAVLMCAWAGSSRAQANERAEIHLQIVGGLAGISQYQRFELPFWQSEITQHSGGRITATIRPLDGGGVRIQEMLQLMRLGVIPFGTAILSVVAGDDPELNAVDLPVLNPDMATLRTTVNAFRDHLRSVLAERYDIELLGVYVYPAQVLFCAAPFSGLDDLAGRKVRTSSVGQSELMTALDAIPVLLPFAEIVSGIRDGVVDCAITGTLSGYEIGLPEVTSHVHAMAISWGISIFGANRAAWQALPADVQETIRTGVADLERRIWDQADADTSRGLACNTGTATTCGPALDHPMKLVPTSDADAARRRLLLSTVVLPRWIERCGTDCVTAWNTYLAPVHGIRASTE